MPARPPLGTLKNKRIACLTNGLLPDRAALMRCFSPLVGHLRIFLSTRNAKLDIAAGKWIGLDIVAQRAFRWQHRFRNIHGYVDTSDVEVPLDTFQVLRNFSPDVVITTQFGIRTLSAVVFSRLRPKTKLIVWAPLSQRTEATRGSIKTTLRRWILQRTDMAFTNAEDGTAYLRGLGYEGPVRIIPYVVDPKEFLGSSTVPEDGVLHLLYAGQLIERKGIRSLLLAIASWCAEHPEQAVRLQIAGHGEQEHQLAQIVPPANLTVHFCGQLNRPDLSAAYRSNSAFLFPTLGDEWGLVVNEAMCAGLPVMGSIHSLAARTLIRDGETGWLFDPEVHSELEGAIDRVLSLSTVELAHMGASAKASLANWTPEYFAGTLADAISELLPQG